MDENLHNKVDQLFQDGLDKFKSDPPDEVWNKIEEALDGEDRKSGWLIFAWKRYAVAAVMLLVGLGIAFIIYSPRQTSLNHGAVLRGSAAGESGIVPESFNNSNQKINHEVFISKGLDTKEKNPASYKSENAPTVDILSEHNIEAENRLQADPDFNPLHLFSTPPVESHPQSLSITAPLIPVNDRKDQLEVKGSLISLNHPKTRFRDRLSLTPYFSKEFAGYSVVDNNDIPGPNGQEVEEHERNVFSASVGLYVNLKISKRWVLQSGLSYSWSNSNIDSAISYAVKDNHGDVQYKLNTISGYGYLRPVSLVQPNIGDSVSTAKSYSQLHYLTIPLIISWRVPMKRFSLLIGAGASFNVLTSAEIETKTYGNGVPEKEYEVNMMGLKKINYGIMVKFDLEYRLNSNFSVNIIPCFKNTLTPINLETAVAAYPYNFGIGAGITYRF